MADDEASTHVCDDTALLRTYQQVPQLTLSYKRPSQILAPPGIAADALVVYGDVGGGARCGGTAEGLVEISGVSGSAISE